MNCCEHGSIKKRSLQTSSVGNCESHKSLAGNLLKTRVGIFHPVLMTDHFASHNFLV